ncbi:helix-turn-helix transcriptional regulator [Agrococcus beijingensis]|uniref:helix-turn-helix transcriptional regulator n=1 Tax=Agrococcus beijingensis TaxID=3068634 RepID=UPI002742571B|nr:helix-turn-helix transcriptional regulator [Agrococcus sp. REN33]
MTAPTASAAWDRPARSQPAPQQVDTLQLGKALRHARKQAGLTLDAVHDAIGLAPSQLSGFETGKREARFSQLQQLASLYGASLDELTGTAPPSRRAELELRLERAMQSSTWQQKQLPAMRIGPRTPDDVLETMLALVDELDRVAEERAATPEEARRANTQLRGEMRARDNHFPEIEAEAEKMLQKVGYQSGPLSQHLIAAITERLGFSVHHVGDLPHSTRSVTDLKRKRIYLSRSSRIGHDPRSVLLQALGHHVLGHSVPADYGGFLRQRIETNYFAAALLMPERTAVDFLRVAKDARQLAVEDLRDAFAVSYETAAHRLTNLATVHLGIPLHFQKVHESGIIYKAYENDGVTFPADHTGAIEGQPVCKHWTSREVFDVADKVNAFEQYTETPAGTFWCTAMTERSAAGEFSLSIGVPFSQAKWFRGRATKERSASRCPDPTCCRRPPADLAAAWAGQAWPSARAHSHLLAALPPGAFPGVDETEVYSFLAARD